jgi:hypothetical protein
MRFQTKRMHSGTAVRRSSRISLTCYRCSSALRTKQGTRKSTTKPKSCTSRYTPGSSCRSRIPYRSLIPYRLSSCWLQFLDDCYPLFQDSTRFENDQSGIAVHKTFLDTERFGILSLKKVVVEQCVIESTGDTLLHLVAAHGHREFAGFIKYVVDDAGLDINQTVRCALFSFEMNDTNIPSKLSPSTAEQANEDGAACRC